MDWINGNAVTLIAGLVLIVIAGLALRSVFGRKNACSCGSCGCTNRKGKKHEISGY